MSDTEKHYVVEPNAFSTYCCNDHDLEKVELIKKSEAKIREGICPKCKRLYISFLHGKGFNED